TYVAKLSGGEKRRLALMLVLLKNPNFLILDEPTNDLDLLTLNKLEEFLAGYAGCLILVSHDRFFMDKLVDHYFVFEGNGRVRDYHGTYDEYRQLKIRKETEKKRVKQANGNDKEKQSKRSSNQSNNKGNKKFSYNQQREY